MGGQFLELLDDIRVRAEVPLTPAIGIGGFVKNRPVLQRHFDVDEMAEPASLRGDFGLVNDFHFPRERQARGVFNNVLRELVHENVSFQKKRCDAEEEVELRRCNPRRSVGPSDVIHRNLGAPDPDALYFMGLKGSPLLHRAEGIQSRMVARHAGVKLEGDVHRFVALAETGGELGQ